MKDTPIPRRFVLFGCDTWAITAELSSSTADELALQLAAHNEQLDLPESASWSVLATRAFEGFPAFILNGSENGGYLLFPGPTVGFYGLALNELVRGESSYWTLEDYRNVPELPPGTLLTAVSDYF